MQGESSEARKHRQETLIQHQLLRQSEDRFRAIFEQAPMALGLLTGRDMVIEVGNDRLFELWGKPATITGLKLLDALPEIRDQPFLELLQNVYDTGVSYFGSAVRTVLVRSAGPEEVYFDFTYTALRGTNGLITGVMAMATDVTQQVLARRDLEQVQQRLHGAVELAELGTWSLDPATRQVGYDQRMRNWLGVDAATRPLSQGIGGLLGQERRRVSEALEAAMDPAGGGRFDLEYHLINHKTGKTRLIHAQARTFFDPQGRALQMVGTAQDITSQRQTEAYLQRVVAERTTQLDQANEQLLSFNEKLRASNTELSELNGHLLRSNEELQQFAHVTSHDLKEPLRKIQIYLDKLSIDNEGSLTPSSALYIDRMNTACNRMNAMITGVLQYSTLDAQQYPMGPVALSDVMAQIGSDLEELIDSRGARLYISDLPVVEGVPVLLYQLFYNLIINALKFSRTGTAAEIRIHTATADQVAGCPSATIFVQDNGIGFEQQYAEKIFRTFSRLHSKDAYEGTGLGLSMCRRIAERHGGSITATGSPGVGATFAVALPLA